MTFKNKFLLLVGLSFLVGLLAYNLAIRKTLAVYEEAAKLNALNRVPAEELNLQLRKKLAEKRELDSLMTMLDRPEGESDPIAIIFRHADRYQLKVEELARGEETATDPLLVCKFSGAYVNMVKFIRSIETLPGVDVRSVQVHKHLERSTKEEKLILDLWIRKIQKNGI